MNSSAEKKECVCWSGSVSPRKLAKLERNKRNDAECSDDPAPRPAAPPGTGSGGQTDSGTPVDVSEPKKKMNGLSFSELCCLFCCPPCPGRIASKLAFLPPEPSYDLKAEDEAAGSGGKFALTLLDRADWQYGDREKECFEAFYSRSSRGNRIACLFVKCSTNAR